MALTQLLAPSPLPRGEGGAGDVSVSCLHRLRSGDDGAQFV